MEDYNELARSEREFDNSEEEQWEDSIVWEDDSTNYSAFQSTDAYRNEQRAWSNQDGVMEWEAGFNDNALVEIQSGGYDNVKEIIDGQFPALGSLDVASDKERVATEIQHLRLRTTDEDAEIPVYDGLGVPLIDRNATIAHLNAANTEANVSGSYTIALGHLESRPLSDLLKRISVGRVHSGDIEAVTSFGALTDNRVIGEVTSVRKGRAEAYWELYQMSFAPGETIQCIDTTSTNNSYEPCPCITTTHTSEHST